MFRHFAAICIAAFVFTSCSKDVQDTTQDEISEQTLAQIKALGFSTQEAKKIPEGYLVEGDIILTEENLRTPSNSPILVIAREEQYRTTNLVTGKPRVISVKLSLDAASTSHSNAFNAALDESIRRYNAENLGLTFQKVTTGTAHITVVAYNENSNVLGSAGFPSGGEPYNQIKMNTYHYSIGTDATNVNYIGTIIAHEMGHCIGLRHTDYMNRSFSCGGRKQNEEKPFSSGYGAHWIEGTPTGPDAASWMLACIGRGVDRPFNSNDKIALNVLYK